MIRTPPGRAGTVRIALLASLFAAAGCAHTAPTKPVAPAPQPPEEPRLDMGMVPIQFAEPVVELGEDEVPLAARGFLEFPGGVADTGRRAYVSIAGRRVEALSLDRGEVLWSSGEQASPLALVRGKVLALAGHELLTLDSESGRVVSRTRLEVPKGAAFEPVQVYRAFLFVPWTAAPDGANERGAPPTGHRGAVRISRDTGEITPSLYPQPDVPNWAATSSAMSLAWSQKHLGLSRKLLPLGDEMAAVFQTADGIQIRRWTPEGKDLGASDVPLPPGRRLALNPDGRNLLVFDDAARHDALVVRLDTGEELARVPRCYYGVLLPSLTYIDGVAYCAEKGDGGPDVVRLVARDARGKRIWEREFGQRMPPDLVGDGDEVDEQRRLTSSAASPARP